MKFGKGHAQVGDVVVNDETGEKGTIAALEEASQTFRLEGKIETHFQPMAGWSHYEEPVAPAPKKSVRPGKYE